MKKLIACVMILCSFSNLAFGSCDFSKGITKLPDGNYEYTSECHLKVGQLVQDNATKTQQIADLNAAIKLKDLAVSYSDARVALWQKSADDELGRLNTIESESKHNEVLYFVLGIAFTAVSVYGASKLVGH